MVIEDDPECLEAIGDALEHGGYAVTAAMDGREALRLLEQGPPPDLILLDLMLPGLDGWQFLSAQRARAVPALPPVVLISGERDLATRARELAVAGYLQKPVELDQLLAMVQAAVARPAGA